MEQHPVPQNVTTFQFRLIGDMTLKQFGYLCAGGILGFISYKLPLPFFFTWPAAVGFVLLGVGFAFVPVEERPMDVWVFSFFKSIYSPTQYLWSHETTTTNPKRPAPAPAALPQTQPPPPLGPIPSVTGQHIEQAPSPAPQASPPAPAPLPLAPVAAQIISQTPTPPTHAQSVLSSLFTTAPTQTPVAPPPVSQMPVRAQGTVTQPHLSIFEQIVAWFTPKQTGPSRIISATTVAPTPSVTGKHMDYVAQAPPTAPIAPKTDMGVSQQTVTNLEEKLQQLQSELATQALTENRVLELQKQLTQVLSERSKMEDELTKLKRQMADPSGNPSSQTMQPPPTPSTDPAARSQPTVSTINTQAAAVKAGLPRLTNVPNVITGIIKDDANNFLPAILVTVTSKDNMPMRALKTNKLGQFAASTPLPNDTYLVEAEDPRSRYTFDRAQITLNGQVVPAIEIVAKSQKQLVREELSKQIFGKNQS